MRLSPNYRSGKRILLVEPACLVRAGKNHGRGRALLLKTGCNLFDLPHHPQDILAEDLSEIIFAVAAAKQLCREQRKLRNVFKVLRNSRDTVKVRAQSDEIYSCNLPNVIDVIGYLRHRGPWNRLVLPLTRWQRFIFPDFL